MATCVLVRVIPGSVVIRAVTRVARASRSATRTMATKSAEPVVVRGDPALEILEAGRERGVDLIALTTHARSGLSHWMMGSVAEKLLHATPVPLLVVRPVRRSAKSKKNGPLEIPTRR